MKCYNARMPLYLETDATGVDLCTTLLQVRDSLTVDTMKCQTMQCSRQLLLPAKAYLAEWWYSKIEREGLGIPHGVEKFYHYCFAHEVHVITEHKPLVAIMCKDVATLSQQLQHIIPHIHQCRVCILYKPGHKLFITDWLSHPNLKKNHREI